MPYKKGETGNPGGRPTKTAEEFALEAACREKSPEALDVILHMMRAGDSDKVKIGAAQYIIDRGWGKAPQSITLEGGKSPLKTLCEIRFVDAVPQLKLPNKKA